MLRRSISLLATTGGGCSPLIQLRALCSLPKTQSTADESATPEKAIPVRSMPRTKQEMYERLLRLKPDSPPYSRILRIGMLGLPGVGKSSLVNRLALYQACATSQKINTTRSKQNVVYTQDNIQLVFLDLPGLMSRKKVRRHHIARSIIRDPHAGVFQSDIVCVIVDVSSPYARKRLDKEVLKALHFFDDKPTVLVLTQIDKLGKRRSLLLDATRVLTDGVVNGVCSVRDSYYNRYRRTKRAVDIQELLGRPETQHLIKEHTGDGALAAKSDEEIVRELEAMTDPPDPDDSVTESQGPEEESESFQAVRSEDGPAAVALSRDASREEVQSEIEQFFNAAPEPRVGNDQPPVETPPPPPMVRAEDGEEPDSMLALLRDQMLLKSASRAEVAARVRKWHELEDMVRGERAWLQFREVFMVSAVSGKGIDNFRQYLLDQAKPGPWAYHSSLASDQDPHDTVCFAVQAQCLNFLRQELPYSLKVAIADYEKDESDTIFADVDVLCNDFNQIKLVLGKGGQTIRKICEAATADLRNAFQTEVCLKLRVKAAKVPKKYLRLIKQSKDFRKSFPLLKL